VYKYAEKHIDVSIEKIGGELQKNPPLRRGDTAEERGDLPQIYVDERG
jgi:hypothetical protein